MGWCWLTVAGVYSYLQAINKFGKVKEVSLFYILLILSFLPSYLQGFTSFLLHRTKEEKNESSELVLSQNNLSLVSQNNLSLVRIKR